MFCLAAVAQPVINEIHYDPPDPTDPAEFVELANAGSVAVDLGGWRLSGGIDFVFPAKTVLPANGFLVVAQHPPTVKAHWGVDALGPWTGRLGNDVELVELRDAVGDLRNRVAYRRGFPWPTVGDPPGYSIELIHPSLTNDLGGNWRASVSAGALPGGREVLIEAGAAWRYFKGLAEASTPSTAWRGVGFADAAWASGNLPIGYDPGLVMATPLDDMRNKYTSVFLRRAFQVSDASGVASLDLQALYDDGFKVWINGVPLLDVNIPAGEVPFDATAGTARESNAYDTFTAPMAPGLLREGSNVIAIQAHNSSLTASSDFFFDLRLTAVRGGSGVGPTPGRRNVAYATNAPPAIRQVNHDPSAPRSGQPVVITAKVSDPDGVANVTLSYQVVRPGAYIEMTDPAYGTDWVSVPMRDDGVGADAAKDDAVFTAVIPVQAQQHRTLVRYRITAADARGLSVRVPYADDPQPNFAYFVYDGVPAWTGAVRPGTTGAPGQVFTVSSNEMNRLPVLHLIAKRDSVEQATWKSRYGGDAYLWSGTLVHQGQVYDHVHYRARGGVWRYAMTKNMWKFDFNRGHELEVRDDWGRKLAVPWSKLNLGACIQQGDYNHRGEQGMFESTGFRIFDLAGVDAMRSVFAQFRVIDDVAESPASQYEGDFWGLYLMLEQPDGRFLSSHGLPDGNLYKMEGGTGELNNLGPAGPSDKSDLNAFLGSYSTANEAWWTNHFEVPYFLSYQTVVQAIHHYDICYDKNYFYYLNPETTRWQIMPWDLDLTWAENMYDAGCGGVDRIKQFLIPGAARFPATWRAWQNRIREFRDLFWNSDEAWRLIDEQAGRVRGPAVGPTLLDADRAQWDYNPKMQDANYSSAPGSKSGQGRYYQWPNYKVTEVSRDFEGCLQLMKRYVGYRSTNAAAQARALDLIAADNSIPSRPVITFQGTNGFPVNRLRFRASDYSGADPVAATRWRIGEITRPALSGPAWAAMEPWKYELQSVWESGRLPGRSAEIEVPPGVLRVGSVYRARVQFEDAAGRTSHWSEPVEFVAGAPDTSADLVEGLRLAEVMYHAPGGTTNEFLELYNSGTRLLDLGGARFTQGIDYTFPAGALLAPGAYALVTKASAVSNYAAFRTYYGLSADSPVFGPYSGNLSHAGEKVVLRDAAGGTDLISFTYGDGRGWPVAADGAGHSLVPRTDFGMAASGALDFGGNWRDSAAILGSPGRADPEPESVLVLNEFSAHTGDASGQDSNDWVELYNRGAGPMTLGPGWYLSDDPAVLRKWQVPAATFLPGRGYAVFDEATGFNNPRGSGFGLSAAGGALYLSHFPAVGPARVVDAVRFKGQARDWVWARVPDGGEFWDAVAPATAGRANAPIPPRVVISEILYHEGGLATNLVAAEFLEFVEVYNDGSQSVELFNALGGWRVSGGIGYEFAPGTTLAAGERVVLAAFDPALQPGLLSGFKATLGVAGNVRVLGPYSGRLDNDTDRVSLERAQPGDLPGDPISWVLVDEVGYFDRTPWPGGADGVGLSYQRRSATVPGSDPANWVASTPTPGAAASGAGSDTDHDGMPDSWELRYGLSPQDPADAGLDADGDGLSNLQEYLGGTDPRDPASVLRLGTVRLVAGTTLEFGFTAVAGRSYVVEELDPGSGAGWVTVRSFASEGAVRTVVVSVPVGSGPGGRWHRVRLL